MVANITRRSVVISTQAVLWVLVFAVALSAQERSDRIPPSIIHEPIRSGLEAKGIVVEAMITDDVGVAEASLYCRSVGMGVYYRLPMRQSADTFYETIPPEFVVLAGVEYYIEARDAENTSTYPAISPEDRPVRVEIVSSEVSSFPEVTMINPEPGEVLETGDVVVAISFVDREEDVDVASIRLEIDGRDVTRNARLSRTLVAYLPKEPFAKGQHSIWITVKDDEGHVVGPIQQRFVVAGAKPKWFALRGDVMVGLKHDKPSIERANVPLWDNQIRAHLMGQYYWLHWDGLLHLSSDETSFLTSETLEDRQPINRYALTLSSRWFDVVLGDSNPVYSDLSLKGILVRGIHASFHWKGASWTFTQGMTKRRIRDSTDLIPTTAALSDTLVVVNGDSTYYKTDYRMGTFRRNVAATRLGLSGERGEIALNVLHVGDDTTSVEVPPGHEHRNLYKPKKNVVATLSGRLLFNRRRTILSAEIGETVVTDNVYSKLDPDEIEELPDFIVKNEDLFKVNASTKTTIKPQPSDNLKPRLYKLGFRAPVYNTYLKAELYRIPLGYVSLGNPQQQTDVKGFRADTRSRLFRDQIDALLGYDRYADNVDKGAKEFTTANGTLAANVGYVPDLEALAAYDLRLNVGLRNQHRTNNSSNDTTKVDNTTNTLTVSLGGKLDVQRVSSHVNADFMRMSYRDRNGIYPTPEFDTNALAVAWRSAADNITASLVGGFTSNKADTIRTTVSLVDLKLTYDMMDGGLNAYGGLSLISTSNDAASHTGAQLDNRKFSLSTGAKYRWARKQSVQAGLKFINYDDHVDDEDSYTEPVAELTYRYVL